MELKIISGLQLRILQRIGEYKFLTISQILKLNIGTKQYKYLWKKVVELRDRSRPLIQCVKYNTIDRIGRVEDIYYLTNRGVEVLQKMKTPAQSILIPKGKVDIASTYMHRKLTIDFQINYKLWVEDNGYKSLFFLRYFDKSGDNRAQGNLRATTKVDLKSSSIIPDTIFKASAGEFERLFLMELHIGQDSGRIIEQIENHALAMIDLSVHKKFHYPTNRAYYVILLFSDKNTLNNTIKRIKHEQNRYGQIHQYFLLKAVEDFEETLFNEGWKTLLGLPFSLKIKPD